MASLILLDTHVVAWLYAGDTQRIPAPMRTEIDEADTIGVSPIVGLELQYLHEIERLSQSADVALSALRRSAGLRVVDASLAEVARVATGLGWTRDPFDRLIAAHATVADAPLATADQVMLANLQLARWG